MRGFRLHALTPATAKRLSDGDLSSLEDAPNFSDIRDRVRDLADSTSELYRKRQSFSPWLGYFCRDDSDCVVGTAAFVGPPAAGAVEIAYHTFPEFEGRGIATAMAEQLLEIARKADPCLRVIAFTRPEQGASTRILERMGFRQVGQGVDEEIGRTWRWEFSYPDARS
jgi:RimJ/RimL family protein N-acetyltransferase